MKQLMIDMMAAMMPYMRPFAILAAALALLALVLALLGRGAGLAALGRNVALAAGVFFLGCEVAGRMLGFEPTVLFASPMDRALYRNQWPFWTLGLAFLAFWGVLRGLGRPR